MPAGQANGADLATSPAEVDSLGTLCQITYITTQAAGKTAGHQAHV